MSPRVKVQSCVHPFTPEPTVFYPLQKNCIQKDGRAHVQPFGFEPKWKSAAELQECVSLEEAEQTCLCPWTASSSRVLEQPAHKDIVLGTFLGVLKRYVWIWKCSSFEFPTSREERIRQKPAICVCSVLISSLNSTWFLLHYGNYQTGYNNGLRLCVNVHTCVEFGCIYTWLANEGEAHLNAWMLIFLIGLLTQTKGITLHTHGFKWT